MTGEELDDVKMKALTQLIVDLMRDPLIMHSDEIRGFEDPFEVDLMELIAYLYELVHRFYYKKPYHYMFHWANKVGSWVEEENIEQLLREKYIQEVQDNEEIECDEYSHCDKCAARATCIAYRN